MLDEREAESRRTKGAKILAVVSDYRDDLGALDCLDLGCGAGIIAGMLAARFRSVVGLDVREEAVAEARERTRLPNVRFALTPERTLALPDRSVDAVILNQVYEHAADPEGLLAEVRRVLRPGGFCFFGARNRIGPWDGHYRFPLLSLMPRPLADLCARRFLELPEYDVRLRTLWGLNRLTRGFARVDYTLRILAEPDRFAARDVVPTRLGVNRLLAAAGPALYFLIPNYIWILERDGRERAGGGDADGRAAPRPAGSGAAR